MQTEHLSVSLITYSSNNAILRLVGLANEPQDPVSELHLEPLLMDPAVKPRDDDNGQNQVLAAFEVPVGVNSGS